tara:strand:+ start:196 stop:510 length:315 start_codon:yes stop_codon:yes gene_type:complete
MIEQVGIGQLKMAYDDLYSLTPRAFWNAVDGFYELIENEDRKNWIRTRWSTTCLINIHLPKGKQVNPQKLIHFEWEKKAKKERLSSYDETLLAYEKYIKRKKAK